MKKFLGILSLSVTNLCPTRLYNLFEIKISGQKRGGQGGIEPPTQAFSGLVLRELGYVAHVKSRLSILQNC